MKHATTTRFPAPAATVIRMMTDRDFHVRKLEALGLAEFEVLAHDADGDDFRIRIQRKVPVQMPGLKGGHTTVINEERWDRGSLSGSVQVEPQGMPVEMACRTRLLDEGDGCVQTFDWDIQARIALVGKTLEKFIVADMEQRAAEETRITLELLEQYR
ncbi:MAG: DUF2505 domain-containing protein [Nevskiales bacterium]|nr:DUF2505 domain-containing protein [Nevskiales bacterium]